MKKRQIFIELTSLLDVILIMLFMLLMQARTQTDAAITETEELRISMEEMAAEVSEIRQQNASFQDTYDSLQAGYDSLQQEYGTLQENYGILQAGYGSLQNSYGLLERQIIADNLVIDNCLVITVSICDDSSISVEVTGRQTEKIPYDWDDETYAMNSLQTGIGNLIRQSGYETVFFVFQYDRSRIYAKEYDLICSCVGSIKRTAAENGKWLNYIETDISSAA